MELFLISKEIEIMRKCKVNLLIHNMHSIFLRWEVNVSTVKCGLAVVSEVTKDFPNSHIVCAETYKLSKKFVQVEFT